MKIYQVLSMEEMFQPKGLRLLDARRVSAHVHGWQKFRVKRAVEAWLNDTTINFGRYKSIVLLLLVQMTIENLTSVDFFKQHMLINVLKGGLTGIQRFSQLTCTPENHIFTCKIAVYETLVFIY